MDQEKTQSRDHFPHACVHTCTYPHYKYTHHNYTTKQNNWASSWSTKDRVSWPCSFSGCMVHRSHMELSLLFTRPACSAPGTLHQHPCRLCPTASHGSLILASDGPPRLCYLHSSQNKPAVLFTGLLLQSEITQHISLLILVLDTID